jgi:biopolymer transport protein ExbD
MRFFREIDEDMHIDMTPMVDAIFAIILFLLVTSSMEQQMEQDISIDLPTSGRVLAAKAPPAKPIIVNVRHLPNGKPFYHVENQEMSIPQLTMNLSRAKIRNKDQSVVIRGDRNVKWEHVARVLQCCAEAGISKISATFAVLQD